MIFYEGYDHGQEPTISCLSQAILTPFQNITLLTFLTFETETKTCLLLTVKGLALTNMPRRTFS